MKKRIENWIIKKLSKYFQLNEPIYFYGNNPFEVSLGENSYFEKPKKINGGRYIKFGEKSSVGHSAWLGAYDAYHNQSFNPKFQIGNNVRIGNYACITCIDEIFIGDGCLISDYVYISDHFHGFDPQLNLAPALQPLFSKGKIHIGENTFIGFRVSILSGVTIGKNCVIGANSVVTTSFPNYSMLAGSPARLIKQYNFENKSWIEIEK